MEFYVIGIDLAKNSFELCGMSKLGRVLKRKKLKRSDLLSYVVNQRTQVIAMEACAGAHYWSRRFQECGFEVRLIPAQYVKPYVKRNKSDRADAEAIAEASLRPTMNFVGVKSVEQQDTLTRHRVRERLVKARTALANEIRGFLGEFGIVVPQGISHIRSKLFEYIERQPGDLSTAGKSLIEELLEEFHELDKKIHRQEAIIKAEAKSHPVCKRLMEVNGVGELTASAVVASAGDATQFKNCRQFSASLGLVPRQHSTGGKPLLLGISKKGDRYIRKLRVHGARSTLRHLDKKNDRRSLWMKKLIEKRGVNKAVVAMANKNARVLWALMVDETASFDPDHVPEAYKQAA